MNVLVTSYEHPDLDGTACSAAYAHLLLMQGNDAQAAIFSSPQQEAVIAFEYFSTPLPSQGAPLLQNDPDIVLVDTSDPDDIASTIDPNRVIEVIDHRVVHHLEGFPHAQSQMELVGSCATLIAEKFSAASILPPREIAGPLYGAIVSNTINFKASVTTDRDRQMAEWLNNVLKLPSTFVHDFFRQKSVLTDPLATVLEKDYKQTRFGNTLCSIFQLEIIDARQFLLDHLSDLTTIMNDARANKQVDVLFVNCIDIEKGYNCIYANDPTTKEILSTILSLTFHGDIATTDTIMMRKQIAPLLKNYLEQ